MNIVNQRVRAMNRDYNMTIDVAVLNIVGQQEYIGKPIEMVELPEMSVITEPTFTMTPEAAQTLMDDLWRCGIRPSRDRDENATKEHLQDMRKIVAAKLGVQL